MAVGATGVSVATTSAVDIGVALGCSTTDTVGVSKPVAVGVNDGVAVDRESSKIGVSVGVSVCVSVGTHVF